MIPHRFTSALHPVCTVFAVALALFASRARAMEPREVFEKASPSVFVVRAQVSPGKLATGSAVAIRRDVLATNCHVVKNSSDIEVSQDRKSIGAKLIAAASERDICLLQVTGVSLPPATIADIRALRPGDRVYSIGSPRGLELTISEGLVSGIRPTENGEVIQTSAAISPGSSGGGLFNGNGDLVGLTTFFLKDAQNLNFAIPAVAAANLLGEVGWESAARNSSVVGTTTKEVLRDSVVSGRGDSAAKPVFDGAEARMAYLRWLGAVSARLQMRLPASTTRVELLETIWYESRRAGLEPALVLGLVEATSAFKKYAITANGARGYMHVAASWATTIGDGDPGKLFAMQTNLRFGCVIMRHYLDAARGDLYAALVAYHSQEQGREFKLSDPAAKAFVSSVLHARKRWVVE